VRVKPSVLPKAVKQNSITQNSHIMLLFSLRRINICNTLICDISFYKPTICIRPDQRSLGSCLGTCLLKPRLSLSEMIFISSQSCQKTVGSIPDEITGFFNWPNPFSCTVALGLTQPLTEMSTRNLPGSKGWLACKADSLTPICEPTV
jgi:hypothetical protein